MNAFHETLLVYVAMILVLTTTGCDKKDGTESLQRLQRQPTVAVGIEIIQAQQFVQRLPLTGSVEPTRVATLSSPAEGPVLDCSLREGDLVPAGSSLLRIGRAGSAIAALEAAREEADRQQKEFERVRSLVDDGALPTDQLDAARSNLENARAKLILAEQVSSDYQVTAPWEGIVSQVHVADGRYVAPRAPLIDLFDPESLVLRFRVPERFATLIQEGDTLEVAFDAIPGEVFALDISRAYPELDRQLRTRTFEASLPLDKHAFHPGFFGRISVRLATIEAALTVPVQAVQTAPDGGAFIYLMKDGKAVKRPVELGFEQNGRVLIRAGAAAGVSVIVQGIERVQEGLEVRTAASADKQKDGF